MTPTARLARLARLALPLLLAGASAACSGRGDRPVTPARGAFSQRGEASWYGPQFDGRATASGERFDMDRPSAAHRTLPFGTIVRVRNLDNGREIEVRINDRGPFVRGRILDLSRAAAQQLGMLGAGIADIRLWVIAWPDQQLVLADDRRRRDRGDRPPRSTASPPPRAADQPADAATTLQVGAFRDRGRAEQLAERVGRLDRRAGVYSADGWHRVQIRGLSLDEATELRQRLRAQGIDSVLVEQR